MRSCLAKTDGAEDYQLICPSYGDSVKDGSSVILENVYENQASLPALAMLLVRWTCLPH